MPLSKATAHDTQTKQDVTVHTKKLTSAELKDIFGDYTQKQLEKYHIAPIQITIENNSATAWILENNKIKLDKLTIEQVNNKIFSSYRWIPLWIFLGGTVTAITISALIAIPIIYSAHGCCAFATAVSGFLLGAASGAIIFTTGSIIAIVDGIANHISKKQMAEYLKTNISPESIAINEGYYVSTILFVNASDLPEKLNLLLTDKNIEKNTLLFELNL
jgi:hypothetical protein